MDTTTITDELTQAERRYAAFAILSFWLCSVVGQIGSLIWARRNDSLFVRRYAWLSLAFEAIAYLGQVVFFVVVSIMNKTPIVMTSFSMFSVVQLGLSILTIPLAVRAWRGHDAASWLVPRTLGDRLPS